MIFLRLAGGLGNQLFQIAASSLLHLHTKANVIIVIDGLRKYRVPRDPDSLNIIGSKEWFSCGKSNQSYCRKIFVEKIRVGRWFPLIGVSDRNYWKHFSQRRRKTLFMDGYFQDGWTLPQFNTALGMIKNEMATRNPIADLGSNEVVIHVRGGDFLTAPKFQVVDEKYYNIAVKGASIRGFRSFGIISDDGNYSKYIANKVSKYQPHVKVRCIEGDRSVFEDFEILRSARARIIGNSTFSWWAGAFGDRESITWSPTKYTLDRPRDLFLENEIPIETK